MLALFLNLALRDPTEVDLADNIVLVVCILLLLQQPMLLDLVDLINLFRLQLPQSHVQVRVPIIANGDESLPLLLLAHPPLTPSLFLLFLHSAAVVLQAPVSLALRGQVLFSLLLQAELFFFGDLGESALFLFFELLSALFFFFRTAKAFEKVQLELLVALKAEVDDGRVGRAAVVAHLDSLEHFIGVLPVLGLQEQAEIEC